MTEQRYKITLTLKCEDLTNDGANDSGSEAAIINNTVGAETRHLIEKSLMQTMIAWGDAASDLRKGKKAGV